MKMGFDSPIFGGKSPIKNGWVNVALFSDKQSVGVCWDSRQEAIDIVKSMNNIVYRIHVKVKHTAMP